jgi:hypothetical protein
MVPTVGDDVWGAVFGIQCAFTNMEGVAMLSEEIAIKWEGNHRKRQDFPLLH